jgi:hypothetical protein
VRPGSGTPLDGAAALLQPHRPNAFEDRIHTFLFSQ